MYMIKPLLHIQITWKTIKLIDKLAHLFTKIRASIYNYVYFTINERISAEIDYTRKPIIKNTKKRHVNASLL